MLSDLRFRLRALFRRDAVEQELDEELAAHLEHEVERRIEAGVPPGEARRQAALALGGVAQVQEECRDARGVRVLETFGRDVRQALRLLRKQPGFTLVAVATLALGIGASAAVFSVVDAVLLEPLPYPQAERILVPWRRAPIAEIFGNDQLPWGARDFQLLAASARTFSTLAAFKPASFNLTGTGEPERLDGIRASAGFFETLGVRPPLGRAFTAAEDRPDGERVVVLSDRTWRDRFGGDPGVLGRPISLDGEPWMVIGVMPPLFAFPRAGEMPASLAYPPRPQVWVPLRLAPAQRGPSELAVFGRLAPRATLEGAQAELDLFASRLDREIPAGKGWWRSRATPLPRQVSGDVRRPLRLIFGAVGVVLLIAACNVASLTFTRSLARRREITLRRALGASPGRLVAQFLTESLILAGAGGLLAGLVAKACLLAVRVYGPPNVPRLEEVRLDARAFGFMLVVTLAVGLLVGLLPALGAARGRVVDSLKQDGARTVGSGLARRIHGGLLVSEVALALVLVIATGLLVRTFVEMRESDSGFRPERVLTFQLTLPASKYPDPDRMAQLYTRALSALREVPGVGAAGLSSAVPMGGAPDSTVIRIPGHAPADERERPFANYSFASPGYLDAIGARLTRGRDFQSTDTADSGPVTIINGAMARKYWPGEDPLGREVGVADTRWPTRRIVGITADLKHYSLREEPAPEMYVPYTQNEIRIWPPMQTLQAAVRTAADPAAITASVKRALRGVDPDLPLARVATLSSLVGESMARPRFSMTLVAAFGGLALVLAMIGMYGVISYSVAQRTREIGVRMALGATRGHVFGMVVGQGARLACAGIVLGLLAAGGVTRLMSGFLYGVRPIDPWTFGGLSALLLAVAVLACWVPARRAARVDPLLALRSD